MREIVLPSGKFASMRPVLALDILLSFTKDFPNVGLMERTVTIDGERLTYEQYLAMDAVEFMPILGMVAEATKGLSLKGIV